jgi:predicted small lipoprotein YifL
MRALLLVLLLGTVAAGLAGCGQKGPLVPPPAAATTNLQ